MEKVGQGTRQEPSGRLIDTLTNFRETDLNFERLLSEDFGVEQDLTVETETSREGVYRSSERSGVNTSTTREPEFTWLSVHYPWGIYGSYYSPRPLCPT